MKRYRIIVYILAFISIVTIGTITYLQSNQKPEEKVLNSLPIKPNVENHPTIELTEYDQALLLFSEDVDLNQMRINYNNDEIIGRIEIPNMFNLLLTKTTNNDYYLNHAIDRKKDIKGTEYIDFRTDITSNQVNIYGHNSSTFDIPFRKIVKFLEEDYFNNNPYILIQHDTGIRLYKIASIKKVTTDYEHMNVNLKREKHKNHIDKLLENPIHSRTIEYDENTNILILQTCTLEQDGHFYIITAFELNN